MRNMNKVVVNLEVERDIRKKLERLAKFESRTMTREIIQLIKERWNELEEDIILEDEIKAREECEE